MSQDLGEGRPHLAQHKHPSGTAVQDNGAPLEDTGRPVNSYWRAATPATRHRAGPLEGEVSADIAVIGAGFTGLWTALTLAREHGREVIVLDAGEIGAGASGRNGGFCCAGSTKLSPRQIIRRFGESEARRFLEAQGQAIDQVAYFLDARGLYAGRHSAGELQLAHRPSRLAELEAEARDLERYIGVKTELWDKARLAGEGADGPQFHGGLLTRQGFALNPLAYVRALADVAIESGVTIHEDSRVLDWRRDGDGHRLITEAGAVMARNVVFAMNGYGGEALSAWHRGRVLPLASNVLVTRPMSGDEVAAQGWTTDLMAYDTRHLLHYFRLLPDGRFLFGGRGGVSAAPRKVAAVHRRQRRDFEAMFPAWRQVETERQWSGYVGFARKGAPYVGPVPKVRGAYTALCYHGNGVAMSSYAGRALATLIATEKEDHIPAVMKRPLKRFPFAALRPLYVRLAYAYYGFADAMG